MAASQTTAATKSQASGLLIYDGDCGFCTSAARKFVDFAGPTATIAPWQSLELSDYGLTEADCTSAAYWLIGGKTYRGADAFAHGLQTVPGPLRYIGKVAAVPPVIWFTRAIYPLVAKYRHKLPGATAACQL